MKKFLLPAMCLSLASFAFAQEPTVVFEEDFEWLEPYTHDHPVDKPAGSTVETNDPNADAPQLGTNVIDDVYTYQALEAKGYEFLACCASTKSPRDAFKQIYLQKCYLKFGLTGYYSGLTLPAFTETPADATYTIAFDWCSMRQGSGKWDPTALVVIVKNGDDEKQFLVPTHEYEENEVYAWLPASVELTDATINGNTRISIRNIDEQWPADGIAARWFIDNIKVTALTASGVAEIATEENAPAEYFNLQGVRIANPENGLYIVRKGTKVSKVLVK